MFNKGYIIVDINGKQWTEVDLYGFIKSIGVLKFNRLFGDRFDRIRYNEVLALTDGHFSRFSFHDNNFFYSVCQYKVLNYAGRVVPKNQIVSEFLSRNPKDADDLLSSHYPYVSGFAADKRHRNGYGRYRKKSFFRNLKNKDDEFFDGIRIRKLKPKDRSFVLEMTCKYIEDDYKHSERSWKKYRKTQYK